MKLIADSGGTGTDWALQKQQNTIYFKGMGLHPDTIKADASVPEELLQYRCQVKRIWFYGTGCADSQKAAIVYDFVASIFFNAKVEVFSDLLALAHPIFRQKHGLVGILGTGSSMCYYDGKSIYFEVKSPGRGIDPGSGPVIANRILEKYNKGLLSEYACSFFDEVKKSNSNKILQSSIVNEITFSNLNDNTLRAQIKAAFEEYLAYYKPLWQKHQLPIIFGGSIAALGETSLREIANTYGLEIVDIIRYPIQSLAKHYAKYRECNA